MSKPVKKLIRDELIKRFDGVTQLAVVGFTGVDANTTNTIRARLAGKDIRVSVVKNALAKQAFRELGIDIVGQLLDGPCAVAYGADSVVTVVRELLDIGKETPNLVVKAAFMEGDLFTQDKIAALSKYPTRPEAIGQALSCVLSAGANLAACIMGPAGQIAGILKSIEDKAPAEAAAPEAAVEAVAPEAVAAAVETPAEPAVAAAVETPAEPAAS
jgi:large subunit ribosomal protein L10